MKLGASCCEDSRMKRFLPDACKVLRHSARVSGYIASHTMFECIFVLSIFLLILYFPKLLFCVSSDYVSPVYKNGYDLFEQQVLLQGGYSDRKSVQKILEKSEDVQEQLEAGYYSFFNNE